MRVEIRRRASPAGSCSNPGLIKAYSDSCFESPINFYIASPEHPILGKWTKPSTLKYSQPADPATTQCLNVAMLFERKHGKGRPRTAGCSSRSVERRTGTASTSTSAARPAKKAVVEPARAKRPISPVGASSIQGRREAPRIDTPISGRVAPLHQRSFVMSTLPTSQILFGSFDRQHHPARPRPAGADRPSSPVTFAWSAAASDGARGPNHAPAMFRIGGVANATLDAKFKNGGAGEEQEEVRSTHHEDEQLGDEDPGVRYRVVKLNDPYSVCGRSKTADIEGTPRRSTANLMGHRTSSAGQCESSPAASEPSPRLDAGPQPGATKQQPFSFPLQQEGRGVGVDEIGGPDVDPWVASQVDPFISSLRQALLRDRPGDVPAYVSAFSADRRRETT